MITVREVFIAKPGMASKLATKFKAEMGKGSKVMTDMTGVYNKVVIETEYSDMAAFDREMQEFMKMPRPAPDPAKPSHTEMYTEGKREIFRVW
jgi:predicted homoserine dehydrogenase-like protein